MIAATLAKLLHLAKMSGLFLCLTMSPVAFVGVVTVYFLDRFAMKDRPFAWWAKVIAALFIVCFMVPPLLFLGACVAQILAEPSRPLEPISPYMSPAGTSVRVSGWGCSLAYDSAAVGSEAASLEAKAIGQVPKYLSAMSCDLALSAERDTDGGGRLVVSFAEPATNAGGPAVPLSEFRKMLVRTASFVQALSGMRTSFRLTADGASLRGDATGAFDGYGMSAYDAASGRVMVWTRDVGASDAKAVMAELDRLWEVRPDHTVQVSGRNGALDVLVWYGGAPYGPSPAQARQGRLFCEAAALATGKAVRMAVASEPETGTLDAEGAVTEVSRSEGYFW